MIVGLAMQDVIRGSLVNIILQGSLREPKYIRYYIAGDDLKAYDMVSIKPDLITGQYKGYLMDYKGEKEMALQKVNGKREKIKVVKEKYYGFSMPNKEQEEQIRDMSIVDLVVFAKDRADIDRLLEMQGDLYEIVLNKIREQDATICLVLDDKGNWARGVTVFNRDEDIYNEEIGQKQAKRYALRALKGRKVERNEFEREPAVMTLLRARCPFTKKGQKNVDLSMYERSLLFGKKFQEKYKELPAGQLFIDSDVYKGMIEQEPYSPLFAYSFVS